MGQITATRNLVATKVVRLAGQWSMNKLPSQMILSSCRDWFKSRIAFGNWIKWVSVFYVCAFVSDRRIWLLSETAPCNSSERYQKESSMSVVFITTFLQHCTAQKRSVSDRNMVASRQMPSGHEMNENVLSVVALNHLGPMRKTVRCSSIVGFGPDKYWLCTERWWV